MESVYGLCDLQRVQSDCLLENPFQSGRVYDSRICPVVTVVERPFRLQEENILGYDRT